MSEQSKALTTNEFILRRIHKNQVDAGPPPAISFVGFRPTSEDAAGLSLFRESLISAAELAAGGRKPGEYYVARLPVKAVFDLGLTVIADEQAEGPKGHVLIPQLNCDSCNKDKARCRAVQVLLAELASRDIVHVPDPAK